MRGLDQGSGEKVAGVRCILEGEAQNCLMGWMWGQKTGANKGSLGLGPEPRWVVGRVPSRVSRGQRVKGRKEESCVGH